MPNSGGVPGPNRLSLLTNRYKELFPNIAGSVTGYSLFKILSITHGQVIRQLADVILV